MRFLALHYT